jgi:hypothetical protein
MEPSPVSLAADTRGCSTRWALLGECAAREILRVFPYLSVAKERLNGLFIVAQRAVFEDPDKEKQQQFIAEFSRLSNNLRFTLDEIQVMPVREELKKSNRLHMLQVARRKRCRTAARERCASRELAR